MKVGVISDTHIPYRAEALPDIVLQYFKDAVGSADAGDTLETAMNYRRNVVKAMEAARAVIDEVEPTVPADVWPVPVYADMLFRV